MSVYVSVGVSVAAVGLRFLYPLLVLHFGMCESINGTEKGDADQLIALTYTKLLCKSALSLVFSLCDYVSPV